MARLVRWLLLLGALPLVSCLPVHVEQPVVNRELVHTELHEQVLPGVGYAISLGTGTELVPDEGALRLNLSVARASQCVSTRLETWDTKTTTVRSSNAGTVLVLGAIATSVLGAGLVGNARGQKLSKDDADGSTHLTGTGAMIFYGGVLGPPLLIEGVIDALRSIDSVDINRDTTTHVDRKNCNVSPANAVPITLLIDGEVASARQTSPEGKVSFELLSRELSRPPHEMRVAVPGAPTTLAIDVATVLQNATQAFAAQALTTEIASGAPKPVSEPAPPSATLPLAAPSSPSLFGVRLQSATRPDFEAAIERHGCARSNVENRNITNYDIRCLKLPGFERMKVLYDGMGQVVRVKYSGHLDTEGFAAMEQVLTNQYGSPATKTPLHVTWSLVAGFKIDLEAKFFETELLYVSLPLDAALQRAADQHEKDKVQELQGKRGTAF